MFFKVLTADYIDKVTPIFVWTLLR